MILGATLYLQNSMDAAAFYCDAFHMTIGCNVKHDNGTYLHAGLPLGALPWSPCSADVVDQYGVSRFQASPPASV